MTEKGGTSGKGSRKFNKVAVLMGGPSAEREVSLRSGAAVRAGLEQAGYDAAAIDVVGRVLNIPEGVEAVFIALHGQFGEDGGVQAMLDARRIPYTGAGAKSSERAFNKVETKAALVRAKISTAEYEVVRAGGDRRLSLPVVVKPARQGSSIGVCRVLDAARWDEALAEALKYDGDAIVERFIPGRELTVGIVGRETLPVVEIRAPEGWYNYDAKYTKGHTEYLVPAPIDEKAARLCQRLAMQTFDVLGCRGLARADLRMTEAGEAFVLELNSIPGFTETSLLPKAAACAGLPFPELCDRIMQMATYDA